MKQNFINKACPVCKTRIGIGLFSNREEILRCPNCNELLTENPKRKLLGAVVFGFGLFIGLASRVWINVSSIWGLLILLLAFIIMMSVSNLIVVKKDLVIKHKETQAISYIDRADWSEILKNTADKENSFEIVEELN